MPSAYQRCAASRSPLVQYARPSRAAAAPRPTWSSSSASSSARRAWVMVPATSPRTWACPARYMAIAAGSGGRPPRRRPPSPPDLVPWSSVARPAIARRPAGAPRRPRARRRIRAPAYADAQHGPDPDHLVGQRLEPAAQRGVLPALAQRRDRQLDQVGGALEVLAGQRVADRLGPVAVLLVPVARPPVQIAERRRAARPAGALAGRRRTGGGSGTTGAGRRAGPGTGSLDRAPRAWPCRRPGR